MIHQAILISFDSDSYKAVVQLIGSPTRLEGVPVSRAIPAAAMTANRTVAVIFFESGDTIIATVY